MDCAIQLLLAFILVFITPLVSPVDNRRSLPHVVTSFDELKLYIKEFAAKNVNTGNYSVLLLDTDRLHVGSRDYIFSIYLDDLSNYQMHHWKPVQGVGCAMNGCPNFVKVLLKFSDKLFIGGTNGNSPVCSWRNLNDLTEASSGASLPRASLLIPTDPNALNTAVMSQSGEYFYALPVRTKWRIFSNDFGGGDLSTLDEWFSNAEFVKSFIIGPYVYFFFHEDAEEYAQCSKQRIPRIARLCKGDSGGIAFLYRTFVSFNKATLSCSIAGDYPFNFNEIQDVVWDADISVFHAVFTTQQHQLPRSAICSFSLAKIEEVFNGDFKYQEDSTKLWESVPNQLYFPQCSVKAGITTGGEKVNEGQMPTKKLTMNALRNCKKYQLMDRAVLPMSGAEPFVQDGVKFTGLAVDRIGGHNVFYVATDRGSILKISNSCILEEINVFQTGAAERITKLLLDAKWRVLYIGSDGKLLKLQLERCSSHGSNKRACLGAADPYCGWSKQQHQCISWRDGGQNSLKQNLSHCPVAKDKWSEWSTCRQQDGNLCLCRTRPCTASNANSCHSGVELQFRNCTVDWNVSRDVEAEWFMQGVQHGNWSLWGNWSTCSVTLGTGRMIRSRTCTNPAPRRGGSPCKGLSHDYKSCTRNPPVQEKETAQWTELGMELGNKDTAVQYEVTCRAVGYDLANVSVSVTSNRTVDCTRNGEICKEGRWDEWQALGDCVWVGTQKRKRQCLEPPCLGVDEQELGCTPPTPTQETTTGQTSTKVAEPRVVDTSWGDWSSCECRASPDLLRQDDSDESLGLQYRFPKCREVCPRDEDCPEDKIEFRSCSCVEAATGSVLGYQQKSKRSYSLELLLGVVAAAVVFSMLSIAFAVFCVRHRKRKFDVSRAGEKADDDFGNTSRYQSTPKASSNASRAEDKYDPVFTDESRYSHIEMQGSTTSSNSSRSKDDKRNAKQHTRVSWSSPRNLKNLLCRPKDWAGSQEII